uniref:Butyrophilin subfamily 1 member A1-like n=1 Tax=Oncorhynchus kisutch TaxID=8019 RepID=A0A8C7KRX1_ONCKI
QCIVLLYILQCLELLYILQCIVLGPTDSIVAVAGDDIILPCYLKPNISAEDMTVDWLNLDFLDSRVFRYQNHRIIREDQILFYSGRTSLYEEELWRGNTSLKLTRVQGTDEGRYKCLIQSKSWYDDFTVQVLVKAVGSKPVVSIEGHREGGMGLLCESEGWHPEPELVWLDSKGVHLSAGLPETHRDLDGFYTVKRHVIVQETDTNLLVPNPVVNVCVLGELFDYATPLRMAFIVLCCLGAVTVIGLSLAVYLDVTLDPDTAHCKLILSDDGKQVRHGELDQVLSDNGKRFTNWSCVLGNVGFSGKFYYEVKVEGKTEWTLGVVIQSINRNERSRPIPYNGYWTVELKDGEYTAHADSPVTFTPREEPQKVGVFVDYEKRQVSFYNVEDRSHIYSFTDCSFTEKLYPFFNPGDSDSISLVVCPVDTWLR